MIVYTLGIFIFTWETTSGRKGIKGASGYVFENSPITHGQWLVYVAIGFMFIPFRLILLCINPEAQKKSTELDLYEIQHTGFLNDYDRLNPVTSAQARLDFLKNVLSHATDDEKKKLESKITSMKRGIGDSVMQYGIMSRKIEN